jgi:hypothetical protein
MSQEQIRETTESLFVTVRAFREFEKKVNIPRSEALRLFARIKEAKRLMTEAQTILDRSWCQNATTQS